MKITKKIIVLFFIIALSCVILGSCFSEVSAYNVKGTFNGNISSATSKTSVKNVTSAILSAVRYVGMGIAFIMLTYAFIRYMMSAASERAEIKKNLITFVIGAVVLFAASNIVVILQEFTKTALS